MRISKKGEYALRACVAFAQADGPLTIHQVAEAHTIPKKFLEQILLEVKSTGLVSSKAGPRGGYQLAREAETITIADVLSAVEEPLTRPGQWTPGQQPVESSTILRMLEDIRAYVQTKLNTVTIADLANEEMRAGQLDALMYYI